MDTKTIVTRKHLALCRYVDTSRSLKRAMRVTAPTRPESPSVTAFGYIADYFNVLATWWSMVYVLVEGYKEVETTHPKIDSLLEQVEKVDALRRFRNGMFHFQSEPIHDKLMTFAEIPGVEKWVDDLQSAFEEYTEALFPNRERMFATEVDLDQLPRKTT